MDMQTTQAVSGSNSRHTLDKFAWSYPDAGDVYATIVFIFNSLIMNNLRKYHHCKTWNNSFGVITSEMKNTKGKIVHFIAK